MRIPIRLIELTIAGLGWADLPLDIASEHIQQGTLVRLNTRHQLLPHSNPIDLVWPKRKPAGPALTWLIDTPSDACLDYPGTSEA